MCKPDHYCLSSNKKVNVLEPQSAIEWKLLRIHSGLKLFEAAKESGISRRMIAYFEAGEKQLSAEKQTVLLSLYQSRLGVE